MSQTLKSVRTNLAAGNPFINVLRLASNVADGETVTIGGDVYEIDIINTDSNINTVAAMNATDAETELTMAAHGLSIIGQLIRVENEIMALKRVIDVNTILVSRGRAGTTRATHVTNSDIFKSDAAPASNIPVGMVTTLTPTVASASLVQTINDRSTKDVLAEAMSVNEILIRTRPNTDPRSLACTETLAGANNAWAAAASYGGYPRDVVAIGLESRAANAQEVALDFMRFVFPFPVASAFVQVRTAAGALKTWDGVLTWSGNRVNVGNAGASDWAATDVITVLASE